MSVNAIEFANLLLRANEISEASYVNDEAEEPTVWWDEAWVKPAAMPISPP